MSTQTKWTPGPWIPERFNEDRADESITITAYVKNDSNVVEPVEIADISDMGMSEAEANARLIAAAPNLYRTLQAIIEPDNKRTIRFDSEREYYVADIEGGELARAKAVLAQALGESSKIYKIVPNSVLSRNHRRHKGRCAVKAMEFSEREIDVILRGLTFALDMGDGYFAFHPGQDYNEGDDREDEDAREIAQTLRERLGDG